MEGSIVEPDLYVHDRTTGEHTLPHRLQYALFDGRDELAGDGAAYDRILELEARAAWQGREFYSGIPELAAASGLLL